MSREYVYLSFFKENKIDYIYRSDLSIIEFPCIHCQNVAIMCSQTSNWKCGKCNHSGNILKLIEFVKQRGYFRRLYVPKKEQKNIIRMLERLSKKYPDEPNLSKVNSKVREFIKYYEDNILS
jgi:ribosomal protein S27AE